MIWARLLFTLAAEIGAHQVEPAEDRCRLHALALSPRCERQGLRRIEYRA
jgi:hypothetical protein